MNNISCIPNPKNNNVPVILSAEFNLQMQQNSD